MTAPQPASSPDRALRPGRRWVDVWVRVVAGVIAVTAGAWWLWCSFMVLGSRFSTNAANDPHGYGLMFGAIMAVPAGLVWALMFPVALPRGARKRVFGHTMRAFVIWSALLFAALFTA